MNNSSIVPPQEWPPISTALKVRTVLLAGTAFLLTVPAFMVNTISFTTDNSVGFAFFLIGICSVLSYKLLRFLRFKTAQHSYVLLQSVVLFSALYINIAYIISFILILPMLLAVLLYFQNVREVLKK